MEDKPNTTEALDLDTTTHTEKPSTKPEEKVSSNKSSLLGITKTTSNLMSGLNQQEIPAPKEENVVVMAKYTAYWVNKKEEDKLYTVIVELPHLETVSEAIRDILPLINDVMLLEGSAYVLSEVPSHYEVYQAKKNGHPKTTYPALDYGQLLNQTYVQQISLVEKDPKAVSLRANNEKNHQGSMAESVMPMRTSLETKGGNNTGEKQQQYYEEYVTETVCWCFKKQVAVIKKKAEHNLSMQPMQPQQSLSSSLLEN